MLLWLDEIRIERWLADRTDGDGELRVYAFLGFHAFDLDLEDIEILCLDRMNPVFSFVPEEMAFRIIRSPCSSESAAMKRGVVVMFGATYVLLQLCGGLALHVPRILPATTHQSMWGVGVGRYPNEKEKRKKAALAHWLTQKPRLQNRCSHESALQY